MGKKAKEHRKKVQARNQKSAERRNQFNKILQQLDEKMRAVQPQAPMAPTIADAQRLTLTANEYKFFDDEVEI